VLPIFSNTRPNSITLCRNLGGRKPAALPFGTVAIKIPADPAETSLWRLKAQEYGETLNWRFNKSC
jgi:hypothetical protein